MLPWIAVSPTSIYTPLSISRTRNRGIVFILGSCQSMNTIKRNLYLRRLFQLLSPSPNIDRCCPVTAPRASSISAFFGYLSKSCYTSSRHTVWTIEISVMSLQCWRFHVGLGLWVTEAPVTFKRFRGSFYGRRFLLANFLYCINTTMTRITKSSAICFSGPPRAFYLSRSTLVGLFLDICRCIYQKRYATHCST